MNSLGLCLSDADATRLRGVIARLDGEIARLDRDGRPTEAFTAAWSDLHEMLAIGPEPVLRDCPVCGRPGRSEVTRCGSCWADLTPRSTSRSWLQALEPLAVLFGRKRPRSASASSVATPPGTPAPRD